MFDIIHEVGQKLCNNMYTSSINHVLYNISARSHWPILKAVARNSYISLEYGRYRQC